MEKKKQYHHGNLAESLLQAVDEMATKFGLEAVSLRACAKLVGVSPSSAFRHFSDKRALLTAFASRALCQLSEVLEQAEHDTKHDTAEDRFLAVALAYVTFALDKPAFFRVMWREEAIYTHDEQYLAAKERLSGHIAGGFAATLTDHDPESLSEEELLAWSSVHGVASLLIENAVASSLSKEKKLQLAKRSFKLLVPTLIEA